jgi:Asp-tRNA(Asn)/Glu-tRNA(Gln) amidotransferase A subunit family amidase
VDLEIPKVPRLVGNALRRAVRVIESPAMRVLDGPLLKLAGVPMLEQAPPSPGPMAYGSLQPWLRAPASRRTSHTTLTEVIAALRARRTDPIELSERFLAHLQHVDRIQPRLQAFVSVDEADVRAQAEASARRLRRKKPLSVLDGVPVAVKDEMNQAGHVTTGGTRFLARGERATEDAAPVARLRALGAILVGKTTMHEMGAGASGLSIFVGTARNPWDLRHHTGGSSSGSAAAVASGLVPFAVGCDGGGSIRIPASFCGVVGLKPTFGRISKTGVLSLAPTLSHVGPMTNTITDCALGYAAMAGRDAADAWTLPQPPIDPAALLKEIHAPVKGLRLGIDRSWVKLSSLAIQARFDIVIESLAARGAVIVDIDVPELERMRVCHLAIIAGESRAFMDDHRDALELLSHGTRFGLALGRALPGRIIDIARKQRRRLAAVWQGVFDDHRLDALLTPSTGITGPLVRDDVFDCGEVDLESLYRTIMYCPIGNLLGVPGLSVPMGFERTLPMGCLVHGRGWDEGTLLRVGMAIEEVCADVMTRQPQVHVRLLDG